MSFRNITTNHKWLSLDDELTARYCAWDCYYTAQIHRTQGPPGDFYTNHFWPMVPVVLAMTRRGFGSVNPEARVAYRKKLRAEIDELEQAVLKYVPQDQGFNSDTLFNSTKQLPRLLYDVWELKPAPATKKRPARSTNQAALMWVLEHLRKRDEWTRPLLHNLFHRSRLATIYERYTSIQNDPLDGRVRPTIKLYGANTLRLAYAGEAGEALQQWPREVRHLIHAAPGYVFLARDYSQLEARIIAHLAGDEVSLKVFREGGDIHKQNACDLFALTPEQLHSKEPVTLAGLRNWAKSFLYQVQYGGSGAAETAKLFCPCYRCAEAAPPQLNLSKEEGLEAARRWNMIHEPVVKFRSELLHSVKGRGSNGTYLSKWGYRKAFPGPWSHVERSLYNIPAQHSAAMIIDGAMVRLHELGAPMVLQMHDELILEVREDSLEHWDAILKTEMERPVEQLGGVVFPTERKVGHHWGELK